MEKLPKTFTLGDIEDAILESVPISHNLNAINSFEGDLIFTDEHIFFIFQEGPAKLIASPWKVGYDEIAEYKKTGLAGYRITLVTGEKLQFSNVFRGTRTKIEGNIEAHK